MIQEDQKGQKGQKENSHWDKLQDIELLEFVIESEESLEKNIDFSELENGRTEEENKSRYKILVKGGMGVFPGQKNNI